jgi:hypothetical protein
VTPRYIQMLFEVRRQLTLPPVGAPAYATMHAKKAPRPRSSP